MPTVPPFHSVKEAKKVPAGRVHHTNSECPVGRDIPRNERKQGDGGYLMCPTCAGLNRRGA